MTDHQPDRQCQAQAAGGARLLIGAGMADFGKLRSGGCYDIDKTRQLAALLSDDSGPLLLTRPRRFGKTLTMDTLRRFLELDYERSVPQCPHGSSLADAHPQCRSARVL